MSDRQRREATGAPAAASGTALMWRGKQFTLPTPENYPLDAIEAKQEGRTLAARRMILGEARYRTFRALAHTTGDAENFSRAIMRELKQGNR